MFYCCFYISINRQIYGSVCACTYLHIYSHRAVTVLSLGKLTEHANKHDMTGDWNANFGKIKEENVVGLYGKPNESGDQLINCSHSS